MAIQKTSDSQVVITQNRYEVRGISIPKNMVEEMEKADQQFREACKKFADMKIVPGIYTSVLMETHASTDKAASKDAQDKIVAYARAYTKGKVQVRTLKEAKETILSKGFQAWLPNSKLYKKEIDTPEIRRKTEEIADHHAKGFGKLIDSHNSVVIKEHFKRQPELLDAFTKKLMGSPVYPHPYTHGEKAVDYGTLFDTNFFLFLGVTDQAASGPECSPQEIINGYEPATDLILKMEYLKYHFLKQMCELLEKSDFESFKTLLDNIKTLAESESDKGGISETVHQMFVQLHQMLCENNMDECTYEVLVTGYKRAKAVQRNQFNYELRKAVGQLEATAKQLALESNQSVNVSVEVVQSTSKSRLYHAGNTLEEVREFHLGMMNLYVDALDHAVLEIANQSILLRQPSKFS